MRQPGYLQDYRIYRRSHHNKTNSRIMNSDEDDLTHHPIPLVVAVVQLGNNLDGHEGVIHGGILALQVDDVLGFAYEEIPIPMVTANLVVLYCLIPSFWFKPSWTNKWDAKCGLQFGSRPSMTPFCIVKARVCT